MMHDPIPLSLTSASTQLNSFESEILLGWSLYIILIMTCMSNLDVKWDYFQLLL